MDPICARGRALQGEGVAAVASFWGVLKCQTLYPSNRGSGAKDTSQESNIEIQATGLMDLDMIIFKHLMATNCSSKNSYRLFHPVVKRT